MRIFSLLLVVGVGMMSMTLGCSDDPETTAGTAGSGGTGGMGGGAGGAGGEGGGSGGSGGTGGTVSNAGYCGKSCAMPMDCCPMGAMNCPGEYPNNWTCDSGTCGPPQCTNDDDCTFGGVLMGYACLTENKLKICSKTCAADADCDMLMLKCVGEDDNGMKYCASDMTAAGCKADADCGGFGKCNTASGACECSADADCTAMGVDKCVQ